LSPFLKGLRLEYPQLYAQFFEEIVPNLGPVNGPFPLQELIRALYIFTAAVMLEQSEPTVKIEPMPKAIDQSV